MLLNKFYSYLKGDIAKEFRAKAAEDKMASMSQAQQGKAEAKKNRKMAQKEKKSLPQRREHS